MRPKARRHACIGVVVAGCLVISTNLAAADAPDPSLENSIKATYLYKIGDFVEWPQSTFESPASVFNVCVTGSDPFGDILDKATAGRRIGDHPITVRHLKTVARDSGCQILYVGGSSEQPVPQALDAVRGTAVLTVTDSPQAQAGSGIVQFVVQENRVRFDIDEQAASLNGLTISSKLLSLAASVRPRS